MFISESISDILFDEITAIRSCLKKILLLSDKTKTTVSETIHKYVVHQSYCKIPKVSNGACIIFSKAHFDGLMYGGKFALQNWQGLYLGVKCASQNRLGYLIVGRKFMSVILHEVFPETRYEDVDLPKTQPCKLKKN